MPELPEVETIRRQLEPRLVGATITEAGSHPSAKFTPATEAVGARIEAVGRRGKFLLVGLGDRELVIHLGMTGVLSITADADLDSAPDLDSAHLRAWWALDHAGSSEAMLRFDDVRRFGRIRVVPAGDYATIPTLANAGPEPFDPELTDQGFWRSLKASKRKVKTQLLSQRPIAGVGNIYADEALWLARINPKATRVGPERAADLLQAIREVLSQGIENGGTTLRDYRNAVGGEGANQFELAAYGRGGQPCLRCNTTLRSAVLDARSTVWCPRCQTR